jgi:hypothetical protein
MTRFIIINEVSGAELGIYKADSRQEALDLMAQDAGYPSYQDCLAAVPSSGITASEFPATI